MASNVDWIASEWTSERTIVTEHATLMDAVRCHAGWPQRLTLTRLAAGTGDFWATGHLQGDRAGPPVALPVDLAMGMLADHPT
jgi:hypothetical protein